MNLHKKRRNTPPYQGGASNNQSPLPVVGLLVRNLLQGEEVGMHGLPACLALRKESLGVRSDFREVLAAGGDSRADCSEFLALRLLLGGDRRGTFEFLTQVNSSTLIALSLSYSMRA